MSKLRVVATDEKNRKVLELAKQRFEEQHSGALIEIESLPKEILDQQVRSGNSPDRSRGTAAEDHLTVIP